MVQLIPALVFNEKRVNSRFFALYGLYTEASAQKELAKKGNYVSSYNS
jgi:hypothetical protein